MKHLDLFSGIGGFALAADRVWGKGVEHTFCDNDLFCQEVLKKHWPKAKIYGDIRTLTYADWDGNSGTEIHTTDGDEQTQRLAARRSEQPFILTGGFPCQPFSQAGRRKGTEDDRYLWPEMLRVIREFHPRWVIGENVGGLVTWSDGLVLEQVHADLESEGYEVQSFIIPAVSVNAPHRRDRVWIVGHAKYDGLDDSENRESSNTRSYSNTKRHKQVQQFKRPDRQGDNDVKNPISKRGRRRMESGGQVLERQSTEAEDERPDWQKNWLEVATRLCRVDDGIPRRLDRNPRLKALGNAIVPQVAEEIMKAIALTESERLKEEFLTGKEIKKK